MKVVNPQTVMDTVKASVVNGKVTVALQQPRATNFIQIGDRRYPDNSSKVSSLDFDIASFGVMTGNNAAGQYSRVVVPTPGNYWFEVIVVKDGILTIDGWMQTQKPK